MTSIENTLETPIDRESIYRRNFVVFLLDNVFFNIAYALMGTTTVIPDFVRQLTASEVLIGLFSSLFAIGNNSPQLFIARYILRLTRKKWLFILPNIPARTIMIVFAVIMVWLGRDQPHLILIAFFICYSIAAFGDGIVAVAWADIVGSSLDHRWRARMFGMTSAITGVVMLFLAPQVRKILGNPDLPFPNNYALLFGIAGGIFALSVVPSFFLREIVIDKVIVKMPSLSEFIPQMGQILRRDTAFRSFVAVRLLTSLFLMAAPFYIGYATTELAFSSEEAVPAFLMMQTIGSVLGALLYAVVGARNNLLCMRIALAGVAILPISALLAGSLGVVPLYVGFFSFGMAMTSILSGFINWVVGYAIPDQRPVYVGLANTLNAFVSLFSPILGGLVAQSFGYPPLFLIALIVILMAFFIALRLPHTK